MTTTIARALVVSGCLCGPALSFAQQPPQLSKDHRALLQAVIAAVDGAADAPETDAVWQVHVLRASDGSHYVAFSLAGTADRPIAAAPLVMYVRLATAPATTIAERSAVREWLAGSRIDPRLLPRNRGFAVGDMPAMGAAAGMGRGGAPAVGSADLQALSLEQERNRQRKADQEKERRAALEGAARATSQMLPFEDFELLAPASFADGTPVIQRALTAGPGRYNLYVAWVEASAKPGKAVVRVARRSLELPPAMSTEFALSSVILADRVGVREVPYTALEQRAHPYTIGPTDIIPARDAVFTRDDRISVAFQIVNPSADNAGKPDIAVNFRIVRLTGEREDQIATLSPLRYDPTTLPPEFDVRLGHPVIAAMSAPLASLRRGDYRLMITAEDRQASLIVAGSTAFTVVGTPATLLAEAPPLGRRFDRAAALQPTIVAVLLDLLAPAAPSPELAKAVGVARAGRFVDLLVVDRVPVHEQGVRAALTGMALLSVGDFGALAQFQQALKAGAAAAAVQFLTGAARATQNRDQDAIAAWEVARSDGFPPAVLAPLLADAYLRRGDPKGAAEAVPASGSGDDAEWTRALAATRIATGREGDAVTALDARLARYPDDLDARWLLLHALYSDLVNGNRDRHARFVAEAQRYIGAKGTNGALAQVWLGERATNK
jgi:hypothetical protein